MNTFQYRPLDIETEEIRLLHLLPGLPAQPIHTSIVHTPLKVVGTQHTTDKLSRLALSEETSSSIALETRGSAADASRPESQTPGDEPQPDSPDRPVFEALSYAWGPKEPSEPIMLTHEMHSTNDALAESSVLEVGPNLASALRSLRHPTHPRTLWIDAVCINQMDVAERSHQVSRMGSIYSSAQRVVVWLGDEENDSAGAFRALEDLANTILQQNRDNANAPASTYNETTTLPYEQSTWDSIQSLLTRAWFSRLWILQEVQLSSGDALVCCGVAQMPWAKMKRAIRAVFRNLHVPIAGFRQAIDDADNVADEFRRLDAEDILLRASSRGATDPRDKVYGALNLLSEELRARIEVRYDWSTSEVYGNALLAIHRSIGRLNLLGFGVTDDVEFDGPTWSPRFHAFAPFTPKNYHLCSGVSASCLEVIDGRTIEVVGKLCGTISAVGPSVPGLLEDFEQFFDLLKDHPSLQGRSEQEMQDKVLKCMVAAQLSTRLPEENGAFMVFTPKELWDMVESVICGSDVETEAWVEADEVLDRVLFVCHGMRLIVTEEGMIAVAPLKARVGDVICVLLGCDHPLLLRPSGEVFEVLGICNAHDLCDASALLGPLPLPWTLQFLSSNDIDAKAPNLQPRYVNMTTGDITNEDPRLGPLPPSWERMSIEWASHHPRYVDFFRNTETGDIVSSDPRLTPGELRARGLALDCIRLI